MATEKVHVGGPRAAAGNPCVCERGGGPTSNSNGSREATTQPDRQAWRGPASGCFHVSASVREALDAGTAKKISKAVKKKAIKKG